MILLRMRLPSVTIALAPPARDLCAGIMPRVASRSRFCPCGRNGSTIGLHRRTVRRVRCSGQHPPAIPSRSVYDRHDLTLPYRQSPISTKGAQ